MDWPVAVGWRSSSATWKDRRSGKRLEKGVREGRGGRGISQYSVFHALSYAPILESASSCISRSQATLTSDQPPYVLSYMRSGALYPRVERGRDEMHDINHILRQTHTT
eukprot:scaffold60919_cov41-Tisochrysis_lutea.AAC.1